MTDKEQFDSYLQAVDKLADKKSRLEMVKEFHDLFHLAVGEYPGIANEALGELRINLIEEEVSELKEAMQKFLTSKKEKDLEDVLDALLDLEYVLLGAVISFGMHGVFDEAFAEVHRSNMTKVYYYESNEHLSKEIEYLRNKYGMYEWSIIPSGKNNASIIKRLSDGKILKPSGYSPVNLRSFLKLPDNL